MLSGPIPDTFMNLDYTFTFLSNNYLTSEVPLFVLNSRAMLVIVATNINQKMVGGRLFLNSMSGIHIYLDNETNAGEPVFTGWSPETLVFHRPHHS